VVAILAIAGDTSYDHCGLLGQSAANRPTSVNAAGINYSTLKLANALKRLNEMEELTPNR
jgi:hypothetical protein